MKSLKTPKLSYSNHKEKIVNVWNNGFQSITTMGHNICQKFIIYMI